MVKPDIIEKSRRNAVRMVAATGGCVPVFITDRHRAPDPASVICGLPKGAIVICRDYDHPDRAGYARMLRAVTHECGHRLLIAGDAVLAGAVGADGVHLPEYQLVRPPVLTGFSFVSAACHDRTALRRAEMCGVDLALVSPVFPTRSHAGAPSLGLHRFSRLIQGARVPVAALGGVTPKRAKHLRLLDIAAFAAVDGFLSED